jgi:hypothetical protein
MQKEYIQHIAGSMIDLKGYDCETPTAEAWWPGALLVPPVIIVCVVGWFLRLPPPTTSVATPLVPPELAGV